MNERNERWRRGITRASLASPLSPRLFALISINGSERLKA